MCTYYIFIHSSVNTLKWFNKRSIYIYIYTLGYILIYIWIYIYIGSIYMDLVLALYIYISLYIYPNIYKSIYLYLIYISVAYTLNVCFRISQFHDDMDNICSSQHHLHKEQTSGLSGRGRVWMIWRENSNWNIYIAYKIDDQWEFNVWWRAPKAGNLTSWKDGTGNEVEGVFRTQGDTCMPMAIIHTDIYG